jgi:S-formylglutathione hydrolase
MGSQQVSANLAFGGVQGVYKHASTATRTDMTFSVYVPRHEAGAKMPVLWYLSGLTCTHASMTEKGEYRRACAELGLIFVAPDTSSWGTGVPDDAEGAYDSGPGAGFYVDATEPPFDRNYQMWRYLAEEMPALIAQHFPADMERQSIMGHSMGGHGALTLALRHPSRFASVSVSVSVSAFAPIASPMNCPWGRKALGGYLGEDMAAWHGHDACALLADGAAARSAGGPGHRRSLPPGAGEAGAAGGGLRQRRHAADAAPAGWLRPLLLLHRHLYGRPPALACAAPGGRGRLRRGVPAQAGCRRPAWAERPGPDDQPLIQLPSLCTSMGVLKVCRCAGTIL